MFYTSYIYIVEKVFDEEVAFCNLRQIILINNHMNHLKSPTFNVNDIICKSNRENCSKEVVFCVSSNFWRNVSNFFSRNVWYIILMISLFNHCFGHYQAVANEQLNIDLDPNTVCKKKHQLFFLSREVKPWTGTTALSFSVYMNFLVVVCVHIFLCAPYMWHINMFSEKKII